MKHDQQTALNRYHEPVTLHGPVCSVCHQRIGINTPYEPGNAVQGNICDHCHNLGYRDQHGIYHDRDGLVLSFR